MRRHVRAAAVALAAVGLLPQIGAAAEAPPVDIPDLPVAITSFGAATVGDHVYVFGGHTGRAHQHSFDNLSQHFLRLDLTRPELGWQALPPGPALQGTALVAWRGRLYRAGGLRALNSQGTPEDLVSVASAQEFDPLANSWTSLPDLPHGRSSHDLAVLDGQLLVVGGWQMRGKDQKPVWQPEVLALDLAASRAGEPVEWTTLTELPTARRALTTATVADRLVILGGMGSANETLSEVHAWSADEGWQQLADLPDAGSMRGFAADATVVEDRHLLASQSDGKIYRLAEGGWQAAGQLDERRFFHRLLATDGGQLLAVGGTTRRSHLASTESHAVAELVPDGGRDEPSSAGGARWPSFRNGASSRSSEQLPLAWSDEPTWTADLVGFGHSSPVAWDDTVYVTSVTGEHKETVWLTALKLSDGSELWRRSWDASETMESGEMISRAAPTPAVDEERLVLLYGSGDFFAVDRSTGERFWHRNLVGEYGTFTGNHGVANSVLRTGDLAVVLVARKGYSYLLAVDVATGENRWKAERAAGVSWTTPVATPDGREIVVSSNGSVEGFDAATGERLWWMDGVKSNTSQSPTVTDRLILIGGSEPFGNFALDRSQKLRGKLTDTHVAWKPEASSYFNSPVLGAACAYFVNKTGVAHCVDPTNGEIRWRHRLGGELWATPIVTPGRIYFFAEDGATTVLADRADEAEVLATSAIDADQRLTAVAAAGKTLLLRAGSQLFAIR